jgi:hypothetical protein
MVDLVVLQTASYLIAALSFAVTCAYYIMNLKNTQQNMKTTLETRQAQLFTGMYQAFYSKDFADADAIISKLELKNVEDWKRMMDDAEKYKAFSITGQYYEGIGVLVKENLVDIRLVADLMSGGVIWYWEHFGPGINDCRVAFNWPRIGLEAEYLYNRIIKYGREHPELKIASPSSDLFNGSQIA